MFSCLSHTNILDIHSLIKSIIKWKKLFPENIFEKKSFFLKSLKKIILYLTTEHLQKQTADASSSSSHTTLNLKCVSF